jgi:uncharacterized protein (TIGR02588 family)
MSTATENRPSRKQDQHKRAPQDQQEQGRSLAEWISFGIATAFLLAVAGLVFFVWFTAPAGPPVITVIQVGDIREVGAQFYVPFEVNNAGGDTAEAVQVLATLRVNGEVVEQSEQQFDFLSGGETEQGTFVFTHDPREGDLELSIGSYKIP